MFSPFDVDNYRNRYGRLRDGRKFTKNRAMHGECLQCRFQLYPNVLRACSTFLGRGFEVHPCRKFPFYLMFVLHTRKVRINNIMLNLLRCE